MKAGTSFLLGVVVGALAVVIADRTRRLIQEEDVDSLKERISDGLRNLEGTVGGLTDTLSEALK